MAIDKYQLLNEQGVQKLAELLLGKVNVRIGERIVTEVNENSSDKQVASAKALYKLVAALQAKDAELTDRLDEHDAQLTNNGDAIAAITQGQTEQDQKIAGLETNLQTLVDTVNSLTHLTIETVEGPIENVVDPKTDVMYLQRDDENDKTWMMYIYQVNANPDYVAYNAADYFTVNEETGMITGLTDAAKTAEELIIPAAFGAVDLMGVAENVFADAAVTKVKFMGTEEQWAALTIEAGNDPLVNATKEYGYVLPAETVSKWINIGDTEVDLSNYWSKDNIEEMREALGIHDVEPITDEQIVAAVDAAFANTEPDLTDEVEEPTEPDAGE